MRFYILLSMVTVSFLNFGCSKASLIGDLKKAISLSTASSSSAATAGQLTVQWTTPTQNTDNSVLTDLSGCRVYYGTASGGPYGSNAAATCAVGAINTKAITGLTTGLTYYFVVRAYDTAGNESADSTEVSGVSP